jgi:hypothetical protein
MVTLGRRDSRILFEGPLRRGPRLGLSVGECAWRARRSRSQEEAHGLQHRSFRRPRRASCARRPQAHDDNRHDDHIRGGHGNTHLHGNQGDDEIDGGSGFDDINGNAGSDTLHGNEGDDWVVGGKDNDEVNGDAGNDLVYGNIGADTLDGGDGNDTVRGGQGDDSISGGAGDDMIFGDKGADTMTGGEGADTFHFSAGAGNDVVTDFNAADGDKVQVAEGSVFKVSQDGSDVVIEAPNGDTMTLQNVQLSDLPDGWLVR